jgi:hypothetical protein
LALRLGLPSSFLVRAIGLAFLGYAGFLFSLAVRPAPLRRMAVPASLLDARRAVGSVVGLLLPGLPQTSVGRRVIGALAALVAGWGLLQVMALARLQMMEA